MTTTTKKTTKKSEYSVIRCDRSGVFVGILGKLGGPQGRTARIRNVRNLHYWDGAASVLQLGAEGVKEPQNCRFTMMVPEIVVTDVVQVVPCTPEAEKSLLGVAVWKR